MPEYSNLFVVLMGLGTVFAGLLCIILLVTLMSWVCARTSAPPVWRKVPKPRNIKDIPKMKSPIILRFLL